MGKSSKKLPLVFLVFTLFSLILCFTILQFISPTLYGIDGYYHAAVSNIIKNKGINYEFTWAQFSLFKDFFSDKDLLFRLGSVPFFYLSRNIVLSAKYAIAFFNLLFFLIYLFILRKYLPPLLTALFLILPVLSVAFSVYFLYLRPASLANIFLVLTTYFLIEKKWVKVFILSLLYSLAHISFPMIVVFALVCETIRYFTKKEFFIKNIVAVFIGVMLGCLLHPNNPNNWLSLHLNAILVPFYSISGAGLNLGSELFSASIKMLLLDNLCLFISIIVVLAIAFSFRVKPSFVSLVWLFCTAIYLALAFFAKRFWYPANVLFFVFFASFLNDWFNQKEGDTAVLGRLSFIAIYILMVCVVSPFSFSRVNGHLKNSIAKNLHYERVARWMNENIPAGELVYHSSWSDTPYFMCFNPKNNYFVVLDPVYMFYGYPQEYVIYSQLRDGFVDSPHQVLRDYFKVNYGYTGKDRGIYLRISNDSRHFKILYEDRSGIVFEVI